MVDRVQMQFEDELEPELDQYDETLSGEDYETWPGDANTTFGEKKKRRYVRRLEWVTL